MWAFRHTVNMLSIREKLFDIVWLCISAYYFRFFCEFHRTKVCDWVFYIFAFFRENCSRCQDTNLQFFFCRYKCARWHLCPCFLIGFNHMRDNVLLPFSIPSSKCMWIVPLQWKEINFIFRERQQWKRKERRRHLDAKMIRICFSSFSWRQHRCQLFRPRDFRRDIWHHMQQHKEWKYLKEFRRKIDCKRNTKWCWMTTDLSWAVFLSALAQMSDRKQYFGRKDERM